MISVDGEIEVDSHLRVHHDIEVRVTRGDLAVGYGRLMRFALSGRAGEALTLLFQKEDGTVRHDAAVGLHDVERARPSSGEIRRWARLRAPEPCSRYEEEAQR